MNQPIPQSHTTAGLVRMSLPRFIQLATSIFLVVGLGSLIAWQVTGKVECVRAFFDGSGAIYLVFLAALEFSLGRLVVRQFSADEPLQPAWFLIMVAGGCHLVGALCTQVLSSTGPLNPLRYTTRLDFAAIHRFGLIVGGPLQMVLLAAGLGFMLRMCRRSGMAVRFRLSDWMLISIAGVGTCFATFPLVAVLRSGEILSTYDLFMAARGPLLIVLLIQASRVKSYMATLGGGLIAKCWSSVAAAIILTSVGNLGWCLDMQGVLLPGMVCVSWFIPFLSATAYALAPAWQIEAIQSACGNVGVSRFNPVTASLTAFRLLNPGRPQ
jgi:hypothetical protein